MSGAPGATSTSSEHAPILAIQGVVKRFGGLIALNAVDLRVRQGHVHAVIGPNGSGKTTLLNIVSGVLLPESGGVRFNGQSLLGLRRHQIARLGLSRTFQNIRLFHSMSVLDNVIVAQSHMNDASVIDVLLRTSRFSTNEAEGRERAGEALALLGMWNRRDERASALPYAQQRLVEVARAIVMQPKLLLLDEPAAGMNMTEARELMKIIASLCERGLTILLVEHNVRMVMGISDCVTVLDFGRVIAEGAPASVQRDPAVIAAYLGKRKDAA